ncbi:MAG: malate dehydrogenase, partial [Candidatus Magasanikbacteria bacterium RIFCSPLOWO2_02_FULL_44_11]
GKIEVISRAKLETREDLCLAYTPGVAEACQAIVADPSKVYSLTRKHNLIAVVTDGSAVLGLGNIGPEASLPVMEGKAALFKAFADVDAVPIALKTQDVKEIVRTVELIAPMFGGINLEDIAAPRCFEIEKQLIEKLNIPVFHDDQHGTAIVVLAALHNALRVVRKQLTHVKIVINGAGAAGISVAKLLLEAGAVDVTIVDTLGAIYAKRPKLEGEKKILAEKTNLSRHKGNLADVLVGADVFIGVSRANIVTAEMVQSMRRDAIVFAMANPIPEIMPDLAKAAGARVVATGRSDFPNQVNNVLVFPGVFRGLLDGRIRKVSEAMKLRAAYALADYVKNPTEDCILPSPLDKQVSNVVADAIRSQVV